MANNATYAGGPSDLVLTWAIGTPDNPMYKKNTTEVNRKNRKAFEQMLHDGGFEFTRLKGNYGISENPYFIMNLSLEDAEHIFNIPSWNQKAFIFGKKNEVEENLF